MPVSRAPNNMSIANSILCTSGPSHLHHDVIKRLGEMEVDLFRLNLSHTPVEKIPEYVDLIRANSHGPTGRF
ncbi:MAG: hypothetical protein FI731_04150 [SAR202 cluster bacterium]|nr:hypothetical protein [SAR202 cluster bacterium]